MTPREAIERLLELQAAVVIARNAATRPGKRLSADERRARDDAYADAEHARDAFIMSLGVDPSHGY